MIPMSQVGHVDDVTVVNCGKRDLAKLGSVIRLNFFSRHDAALRYADSASRLNESCVATISCLTATRNLRSGARKRYALMVLASHVIFGTYGFWLPNDPRGSWSDFVGAWGLFRYGKATKTTETVSLAYRTHDR